MTASLTHFVSSSRLSWIGLPVSRAPESASIGPREVISQEGEHAIATGIEGVDAGHFK